MFNDPNYPDVGLWATTYDDDVVDYRLGYRVFPDTDWTPVSDAENIAESYWVHDLQLGGQLDPNLGGQSHNNWDQAGWATVGTFAGVGGTLLAAPPAGTSPLLSHAPQTWPIRGAEREANSIGFLNDLQLLNSFLSSPSVRNLYALGDGSQDSFSYLSDLNQSPFPQRYRFVFLDGCDSYSYANFSKFGALESEVLPQTPADNSNNSVDGDLSWYGERALKPAAFIGGITSQPWVWIPGWTDPNSRVDLTQGDPWTTPQGYSHATPFRLIEAVGNWHLQFLCTWIGAPGVPEVGVLSAKRQADYLAWQLPSSGGYNGVDPKPPPAWQLRAGKDATGNTRYYNPVTSVKIAGYRSLGFNGWNKASDGLPESAP